MRPVLVGAAAAALLVTAACSSHAGSTTTAAPTSVAAPASVAASAAPAGQFRFAGMTSHGDVLPVASRKPAGAVTGSLLDGTSFDTASYRGKVVVLNFFATWCGPCKVEIPDLQKAYTSRKAQGVQLVGVDVKDASRSASSSWLAGRSVTYPVLWDLDATTARQLGNVPIVGLPDTVVLDRAGRVAAVYAGQLQGDELGKALDVLVKETP